MASAGLKAVWDSTFTNSVERIGIMLRGHSMAIPLPSFGDNVGIKVLRELDGTIQFAQSGLTGSSVFDEID